MRVNSVRPRRPRIKLGSDSYQALWRKVLERDGWRCQECGRANELQVHHVRFRSALGDDDMENLITLCSDSHRTAHGESVSNRS